MSSVEVKITDENGKAGAAGLNRLPDKCPYCHHAIQAIPLHGIQNTEKVYEVMCRCPRRQCGRSFIAYYGRSGYTALYSGKTSVGNPKVPEFDDNIKDVSEGFCLVYTQAHQAEELNLLEICGVGYRKALEFLIKDYVITKNPEDEEKIKKMPLAQCIKNYVTDTRLKSTAEKATWLGNDETHYVRKWQDKDLSDLKILLNLTTHWIIAERLTESFEADMSGPAPA